MVEMKAVDTLFISSWSPDNIPPGGKFEVSAEQADRLEKDGLAKRVHVKAEPAAPENKMEAAPANKAQLDHDGKDGAGGSVKGFHSTAAKGARRRGGK